MQRAVGRYVFFMDGDDTLPPGALGGFSEAITESGFPDLVHIGHDESFGRMPAPGNDSDARFEITVFSVDEFLKPLLARSRVGFQVWQFFIKRQLLIDSGITFGKARICEDNIFTLRCLMASRRVGLTTQVVYHWRTRLSGSLTSAHVECWDQIVLSACEMLEIACSNALSEFRRQWAIHNVHSVIVQFEDVAAGVRPEAIASSANLFVPFSRRLEMLKGYIGDSNLLGYISRMGPQRGASEYCRSKARSLTTLLSAIGSRDLFGFPGTRRCSRLLQVIARNGPCAKGILDNEARKQGLMLDGVPILTPEIIPLCYGSDQHLFVVISTYRRSTGTLLADQLRGYGLVEGVHFLFNEFETE
jgi:hypothetical protein